MKSRVGSVFATMFALIFAASNASAHSSMFGSGMYGGLQSCPFPYGMPAGVLNTYDDISFNNQRIADISKDEREIKENKRSADKDLKDAEKEINDAFQPEYAKAIMEHLKGNTRCDSYDWSDNFGLSAEKYEDLCQQERGTAKAGVNEPDYYKYNKGAQGNNGPEAQDSLSAEELDRMYPREQPKAPEDQPDTGAWIQNIFNFFKKTPDATESDRMPAAAGARGRGPTRNQLAKSCSQTKIPAGLSVKKWKKACPIFWHDSELPPGICSNSEVTKKDASPSRCIDALKDFRKAHQDKLTAENDLKIYKDQIKALRDENRRLAKDFKKEMRDAQTEAVYCPECAIYESQRRYDQSSTASKVGSWIGAVSPLLLAGAAGASSYFLGKDYMDNASKLGYLTGPTPSPMAFGFPYMLAGIYGSVAAGVNGGFGCSGGPWGGAGGIFGPYGNGGLYGGMGGAFGMPPWMMGMPMAGGALMPGMGPWGMASPFGLMNPFMGGMGGIALMGMAGMVMPMGGMGMPIGGFPMGGFAIGGMGGLALMGGMGMPIGGFPMGGFAIGGMGGLALMGGMGMAVPGFALGGFPMGGMAMMGMAGMAGMDMGMSMQFQMMQQQMQMQQYQMMMGVQMQMQQRSMARNQMVASLSQEMMALQMRIQQVSMGFDVGFGMGGMGGMPFPGPYSGGPFPPPYVPPYLRPGVSFPGYFNSGSFQFYGLGR